MNTGFGPAAGGLRVAAISHPSQAHRRSRWQGQPPAGSTPPVYRAELANFGASATVIAQLRQAHGPAAGVVNAASITRDTSLRKMASAAWRTVLGVNLDSGCNVCRSVETTCSPTNDVCGQRRA